MLTTKTRILAGALACFFAVGVAVAHHGWSGYDDNKTLNLTGLIQESNYGNPHGTLKMQVPAEGAKSWTVILAPPSRMSDRGLSREMLEKGTSVTIVGYPHKEHKDELRAERITVGDKTVELR